jgi:hypothetical protein
MRWPPFIGGSAPVNHGPSTAATCRAPRLCYRHAMADQRALDAVRRIERALARIEAAASRPSPSDPQDSEEYRRLSAAHDALRSRVAGAIGEIDQLVAAGERG